MNLQKENHDVVIVGTGTAGLSAALAAYEKNSEAKLLLIEKAPRESRGGNGRFTGGDLRYCHKGIDEIRGYLPNVSEELLDAVDIPEYTADDFYTDIMRVTRGCADREFWELVIRESNPAIKWLTRLGVVWDIRTERTVKVDGRFVFRHGEGGIGTKNAGEGLIEGMFEIAERQGLEVRYDTKAVKLLTDNKGAVNGVKIFGKDGLKDICCRSVILATGGFSANVEMRTKYLGPKWDLVKVRGSRYNTGEGLKMAMELGAAPIGQWSGSHNTILDADAPDFGAGMGAARYTFQHSIMVNENGQRFVDEGSDFQIYTYAKMGSIVLEQPRGIAFQIFDNKVIHLLREEYANAVPIKADTLEELAKKTDIDPENLVKTVTEFNKAVQPGEFNPVIRDGKGTKGITPPKSNWARKIDTPPYTAYAITTGITFSFGGLKVDKDARILNSEGKPIQNLYATGEMVGGSFYYNYAMGSGITKNVVLGRIAGYNAASFGKEITS